MLNRLVGLGRDTWWLWLLFLIVSIVFTAAVDRLFLVTFPVLAFAFVYYAIMRYDDDGNHKGEDEVG